jgi:hypothetical protein
VEIIRNAVKSFISRYGEDVTIIHRTPSEDGNGVIKDKKGHIVYKEDEITTKARVNFLDGTERFLNNATVQACDAIAIFETKDAEYLNENSWLKVTNPYTLVEVIMKMLKPKATRQLPHIEVQLKYRDV